MVQRKVTNKLGIQFQAGGDKSEKLLQQQDLKKKKMKKSGSMKRQDFEKYNERKERHPRKPPPPLSTPNYMKSTSSSEARKEKTQVSSSRSSKTSPDSINSRRKSSGSSSSRMLSRVLTKTPSFKPARSSAKKCSAIVLCENLDVKRSTCSSTLKDYKFPNYLSLNPGGTESEGTSVMKVCPYNYCSFNGHKHASVPPLKKFLSARRLVIKTQRGLKLGCLSPQQPRPAGDESYSRKISPVVEEDDENFYVEIYAVEKEDTVDQSKSCSSMVTNILPSIDSKDEREEENENHTEEIVAAQEELKLDCLWGPPEINEQGVRSDKVDSDSSDMDWEAEYSAFYLDDDDDSLQVVKENNCNGEDSVDDEEAILNPDENVSRCFDEISAEEGSWSSESTDSNEYLEKLNIEIASFLFEDQMRKLDEAKEDKNDIVFSYLENDEEKQNSVTLEENILPDNLNENYEENVGNLDSSKGHQSDAAKIQAFDNSKEVAVENQSDTANEESQGHGRCKRSMDESNEESREFNPRGPNFLELEPDPEAEKLDLKHQTMDERKNAEEWMLDYALRRAVTTLAPARKRKVALLVEAFEKVLPCEPHRVHSSSTLGPVRPIQACR